MKICNFNQTDTLLSVYIKVLPDRGVDVYDCAYAVTGEVFVRDEGVTRDVCFRTFFGLQEALVLYRSVRSALDAGMEFAYNGYAAGYCGLIWW